MAALRGECLKRDRHRCVISGRFDDAEALERVEREGDDEAKDGDGHKLKKRGGNFCSFGSSTYPSTFADECRQWRGGAGMYAFMSELILPLVSEP